MKKILFLTAALLLTVGMASAQTRQEWTSGWDKFNEPLDYARSNIKWELLPTRKLAATYTLAHATPNKLYQVGIHIFCDTFAKTFGQFPANPNDGTCPKITRQQVTKGVVAIEFGVVTTDLRGNGSFKVVVGPIASGTYDLEFSTRNGAGCNLIGGGGNGGDICEIDFQSPGPFGTATEIIVP